jgi:23S rRNA (guanosine2251-2'-O)-methyltransferase
LKRLLLGTHAVLEALRAAPDRVVVIYTAGEAQGSLNEVVRVAREQHVRCEPRERAELDALADGIRHQGVLAITGEFSYLSLDELLERAPQQRALLVALDQITDPHNFGAIVRSAVAFGADGLITLKDRAAPVTPVVVRASAGATEAARIARVTNLARTLNELSDAGMQVIGLDAEGKVDLRDLEYGERGRVLVVGSEGYGLRRLVREHCETLAAIPLPGPLASLNASVAAGIAIYESARRR